MGLRPIAKSVHTVSDKTFSRKHIALARMMQRWCDIIGTDLADQAQPSKIKYRKSGPDNRKGCNKKQSRAILVIAVHSAQSTLLHYRKDLILSRINQIFGEDWITDIQFTHIPANSQSNSTWRRNTSRTANLAPEEEKKLTNILDNVGDDELRHRLDRFGKAIWKHDKDEIKKR
jgi:hypothetical protein